MVLDHRQLNKQVPLSCWPIIHLDQELAKVKEACFFSFMDMSNGFWTIKVDLVDQYKLAFSACNCQFTWNCSPFRYSSQWGRTKVDYMGLLVPMAPSFCNYSRQFIKDCTEIARPLIEKAPPPKRQTLSVGRTSTMDFPRIETKALLCTLPCLP